jgi:hypothetical protein
MTALSLRRLRTIYKRTAIAGFRGEGPAQAKDFMRDMLKAEPDLEWKVTSIISVRSVRCCRVDLDLHVHRRRAERTCSSETDLRPWCIGRRN